MTIGSSRNSSMMVSFHAYIRWTEFLHQEQMYVVDTFSLIYFHRFFISPTGLQNELFVSECNDLLESRIEMLEKFITQHIKFHRKVKSNKVLSIHAHRLVYISWLPKVNRLKF